MAKILLWNAESLKVHNSYATVGGAKRARTCLHKQNAKRAESMYDKRQATELITTIYTIGTREEYNAADYEVERFNLMTGKPFKIMYSEVGGPCDPSTERYHCM